MNLKTTTLLCLMAVCCFSACTKENVVEPEPDLGPEFVQISEHVKKYRNGVVEVSKFPIDMTRKNSQKFDYFNFDENKFVSADKAATKDWHIVFVQSMSAPLGNIGSQTGRPWSGNGSDVRMSGVLQGFDDVNTVEASSLNFTDNFSTGISIYSYSEVPFEQAKGYWAREQYDELGEFTVLKIDPKRTFIIKLNDGRYVKFQNVNIYKDDTDKITKDSEKGFLSFRYFVSKAGSNDVKTK